MGLLVYAPCKGKIKDITTVKDIVFAEKMVGDGLSVVPEDNCICSPIDGIVSSIYPKNHAFIITSEEGKNILVHIGIDTVHINEPCFKRMIHQNEYVKRGSPIIEADFKVIEKNHLDTSVIIISLEQDIEQKTNELIATKETVLFSI